ncbi:hypothetical protein MMC32_000849 [Xylographa parallela]|nr:hypothetical protein [Xylographa parallela]
MCASADPPLHCTKIAVFTTGNVCKKKITLPELEARLGHESFERLLKSSLGKYLRRNPETFIYCNTPDCPQVMRRISDATRESVEATKNTRAESAQTFKCNLCHAITCLTCEAPDHTTISCQDNQARIKLENTQLEAWKQTNTAKDCPKCKCAIEIIDGGCLHMKCENCGQHFCWKCMVGLDDGKHAYEHNKYIHLGHMP